MPDADRCSCVNYDGCHHDSADLIVRTCLLADIGGDRPRRRGEKLAASRRRSGPCRTTPHERGRRESLSMGWVPELPDDLPRQRVRLALQQRPYRLHGRGHQCPVFVVGPGTLSIIDMSVSVNKPAVTAAAGWRSAQPRCEHRVRGRSGCMCGWSSFRGHALCKSPSRSGVGLVLIAANPPGHRPTPRAPLSRRSSCSFIVPRRGELIEGDQRLYGHEQAGS